MPKTYRWARTYSVHYGNGHLSGWSVLPCNYRSLKTAMEAAKRMVRKADKVIIADTDGNEWKVLK